MTGECNVSNPCCEILFHRVSPLSCSRYANPPAVKRAGGVLLFNYNKFFYDFQYKNVEITRLQRRIKWEAPVQTIQKNDFISIESLQELYRFLSISLQNRNKKAQNGQFDLLRLFVVVNLFLTKGSVSRSMDKTPQTVKLLHSFPQSSKIIHIFRAQHPSLCTPSL